MWYPFRRPPFQGHYINCGSECSKKEDSLWTSSVKRTLFLAPREVGASIILPVFGSAVVALTCMSNIYRKERQDHAMDLKTLAPWSEEFASRSGKFNRNIMGNAIIEQVMAPSTVQTSVLYKINLNYGDMCLVKGWIWTNTVVKSANLLYEVNISCYQHEFGWVTFIFVSIYFCVMK